jgi:hypothetical protein
MTFDEARKGFQQIVSTSQAPALEDFTRKAVRYAGLRVQHLLSPPARQPAVGSERTIAHDEFIVACDTLANQMAANNEDESWRDALGSDRKDIGDFACFVHCILGLTAR